MTLWKMHKINIHSMNNPFRRMCFQGLLPLRWKLCSTLSSTVSTSNKRSEIIWASSDSTLKQIFEADFCRFESTFAAANQFSKDARNSFLFSPNHFSLLRKLGTTWFWRWLPFLDFSRWREKDVSSIEKIIFFRSFQVFILSRFFFRLNASEF